MPKLITPEVTPKDCLTLYKKLSNIEDPLSIIQEMEAFIRTHREAINECLTERQQETFWTLFDNHAALFARPEIISLSGLVTNQDILKSPNEAKNSINYYIDRVMQFLAHALSRDINLNDKKIKDNINVLAIGLKSNITEELINSDSLSYTAGYLNKFLDNLTKTAFYHQPEDKNTSKKRIKIKTEEITNIYRAVEESLEHLILPGLSTKELSKPEEILNNLFDGIATITLRSVNAHGIKDALPLGSFLHDMFHFKIYQCTMLDSLVHYTFGEIFNKLGDNNLKELIEEQCNESIRKFEKLMSNLKELLARAVSANDKQVILGLFNIFHEGEKDFISPEDWKHYDNLPQLLDNITSRFNLKFEENGKFNIQTEHVDWTSHLDPFMTDPITGETNATSDELIEETKKYLEEYQELKQEEERYNQRKKEFAEAKNHLQVFDKNKQQASPNDYEAAKIKLEQCRGSLEIAKKNFMEQKDFLDKNIDIKLEKNNRFITANIEMKNFSQEIRHIPIITSLYHKRRNAWDMWYLFGKSQGIPKPDSLRDRKSTIKYLENLYQIILPEALRKTVDAARHLYQIIPYQEPQAMALIFSNQEKSNTHQSENKLLFEAASEEFSEEAVLQQIKALEQLLQDKRKAKKYTNFLK